MLRKIEKLSRNIYVAASLVSTLLFASCQKQNVKKTTSAPQSTQANYQTLAARSSGYSGEQIFEAIFFGKGTLMSELTTLSNCMSSNSTDPLVLHKRDQAIDSIKTGIYRYNANYFTDLKYALDNYNVSKYDSIISWAALDITLSLLKNPAYAECVCTMLELEMGSPDYISIVSSNNKTLLSHVIDHSPCQNGCFFVGLAVAVVAVLVVWEGAVAVNVTVLATFYVKAWALDTRVPNPPITKENIIAELYGALN